jgi:hypothetical protein
MTATAARTDGGLERSGQRWLDELRPKSSARRDSTGQDTETALIGRSARRRDMFRQATPVEVSRTARADSEHTRPAADRLPAKVQAHA